MALRDQPYLPLYVQDFLTDEKLIECSAQSTGVYIRLICIMHKSEEYGTILLKQKDKHLLKPIKNFSLKLDRQMPYSKDVIENSLTELLEENVISIDGDKIVQKRMVKDNVVSNKRAEAGRKGGKITQFDKANVQASATISAKANVQATSEYEYEDEYEVKTVVVNTKKQANELFEELWKLYPERKGKASVTDKTKEKWFVLGKVVFEKCLKRYKAYIKKTEYPYKNGSTFFNSGYVDYLDENFEGNDPYTVSPEEQAKRKAEKKAKHDKFLADEKIISDREFEKRFGKVEDVEIEGM